MARLIGGPFGRPGGLRLDQFVGLISGPARSASIPISASGAATTATTADATASIGPTATGTLEVS